MRSSDRNRTRREGYAAGISDVNIGHPNPRPNNRPLSRVWVHAYARGRDAHHVAMLAHVMRPFLDAFDRMARAAARTSFLSYASGPWLDVLAGDVPRGDDDDAAFRARIRARMVP